MTKSFPAPFIFVNRSIRFVNTGTENRKSRIEWLSNVALYRFSILEALCLRAWNFAASRLLIRGEKGSSVDDGRDSLRRGLERACRRLQRGRSRTNQQNAARGSLLRLARHFVDLFKNDRVAIV